MAVDEQGESKVEHTEKKPLPTKRSLRLKILLLLVLGWTSVVRAMEESGTIANLLVEANLAHQRPIINNQFHFKSVRNQIAPM
jgi:hypothetical protein